MWLAGAGALFFRSSSGWVSAGSTCAGEHHAAWARADGRVYFGTDDAGLRYTDPDAGSVCQLLPTAALAGDVYGITGFVDAGTVVLYSVTIGGTVLRNTEPVLAAVDRRWDLADAGGKELWTVAGFNQSALFAGGRSGAGANGVIFKFNPATDLWVRESVSINSVVNDISVVSPTLAFAGTEGHDLFIWNGAVWTLANNNMFGKAIYAVKAFGPNEVYATGESALVRQFDGGTWLTLAAFDAGTTGYLARIRGLNSCDLWSAGTNGLVVHSQ